MNNASIVWFRLDLRLDDNPALSYAIKNSHSIIPIYIHAPEELKESKAGAASNWWLNQSLISLKKSLKEIGLDLFCFKSKDSFSILEKLIDKNKVDAVFWNRIYEPEIISRDSKIKDSLKALAINAKSFKGSILHEPFSIENKTGNPYQVFTPYWRTIQKIEVDKPLSKPIKSSANILEVKDDGIKNLNLLPSIKWYKKLEKYQTPGEEEALKIINNFIKSDIENYKENRDFPKLNATSRLSAHLHFGEISPRRIWYKLVDKNKLIAEPFLRQIAWRDFAHHLLFHFPKTTREPLKDEFKKFPWKSNKNKFNAWKKGLTGYPIVDAGMRELWETGIMHNRVRMICSSFLVKHLLHTWQDGMDWFWDTLVDADLANNTMGWQWVAGCGADAAPYFRIFNPILQSKKFDKQGDYIKTFIPELKDLPSNHIHEPYLAPLEILKKANIKLGIDYPSPIVDLKEGRDRALNAYNQMRGNK